MPYKTAEQAYDTMLDLFEHAEPSQAWVDEFNEAALVMENRSDDGIDDALPTTNHVLSWLAWIENGKAYIASPPIVLKGVALRLTLDVLDPLHGEHINVHAIPCDDKGKMLDKLSYANTACLIINPDAGPAMIFAGWDYVAREGIEEALKSGAILKSWVQVVTSKIKCTDLSTIEEAHALKMFQVYVEQNDLDHAIVEYRKINAGNSSQCSSIAVKYNKLRYHLGIVNKKSKEVEKSGELENEYVRKMRDRLSREEYTKWVLNGVPLDRQVIVDAMEKAELDLFPDKKTRNNANDARNMRPRAVINAIAPGQGIPVALVPEAWAFTPFVKVLPDESTNRTDAIRQALEKIGRKSGYDGKKFTDVSGVLYSEIKSGFEMKPKIVYTKYKGILVDTKTKKVALYEYKSCLNDDSFQRKGLR